MLSNLEVKFINEKKGRGLFAKVYIPRNKIIDKASFLFIEDKDYEHIKHTNLDNYTFEWDEEESNYKIILPLSICQFMNHSYNPNVRYEYEYQKQIVKFVAIRGIEKGEELTVNYNGDRHDKQPVWFDVEE